MSADLLFYVGIALLFTHELDATYRHEWRIFPLVSRLRDDMGYLVFVVLHIPLFVLILWLLCHPSENVRFGFQVTMDIFFMVHLGLHLLLKNHAHHEFTSTLSKSIIFLNALVGLVHLVLIYS